MARHLFGGVADYAISRGADNTATLQPNTVVTCWNQAIGGTQYTDLVEPDGTTVINDLVTDTNGAVPEFRGPDQVWHLYLDAHGGSGPRRRTVATDIGTDVSALQASAIDRGVLTTPGDLLVALDAEDPARLPAGGAGQMLVVDPVQEKRIRWGHAWRRRDLPDPLLADGLSAETPTVTVTKQSTSTITDAQPLLAPDTGPFLYVGAGGFQFGTTFPDTTLYLPTSKYPNTYSSGQSFWAVEFCTDAAEFEILFKHVTDSAQYRLSVDGRKVTDLTQSTAGVTIGSRHVLKVDLGSARPRRIRFDFAYVPFGGLYLPPGAAAWKPAARGGRLAVLADSVSDGSEENTGFGVGAWPYRAGRLLGCTDVWDQGRGGTGYITPGSWATFGDRVAGDITPYSFDRLIVWGGYNDNQGSQSAIAAAADNLYMALAAALPAGADVTVIGCWDPSGTGPGSIAATDDTLKAAAMAAGLPFISPVTGDVYDGAGVLVAEQGPFITPDSAQVYIGSDGVHPNDAGHLYLAHRIVEALRALMPH